MNEVGLQHKEKETQPTEEFSDGKILKSEKEIQPENQEQRAEVATAEMSDSQLSDYVAGTKEKISQQTSSIESDAKLTVESSIKSMGVSQEFVDQALSQSELGSRLKDFQEQADELAKQANSKIESTASETGGEKISKQEQTDRFKQLNDFRDRWLIAKRIGTALEAGKYKIKDKGMENLSPEEAKAKMQERYSELSREIITMAAEMNGQTPEEFKDKIKKDSGYAEDESKKGAYRQMLTREAERMFNQKKDKLEQLSGKKVTGPKGREKIKQLNETRKNKSATEPVLEVPNEENSEIKTQPTKSILEVEPKQEVQVEQQVETKPSSQEGSGEIPDPKKELESIFEQRIDNLRISSYGGASRATRAATENEILSEQALLEKVKNGVFPEEINSKLKQELIIIPGDPIDEEDYRQHKDEYDRSKKEYEEKKAKIKRISDYIDQQRLKSEQTSAEQTKPAEAKPEIPPVPVKRKIEVKQKESEQKIQPEPVQEVVPKSKVEESIPASPEHEKFQELIREAAREGCVAAYSSWPGENIPNQAQSELRDYGTITDPRINREGSKISRLQHDMYSDSELKYGYYKDPIQVLGKENCQEVISMSLVQLNGTRLNLKDFTGRPEDAEKPALAINYAVVDAKGHSLTDHTGRDNTFFAQIFLPEELAKSLYGEIQQNPSHIRELLEKFNQAIVTDPNVAKKSTKPFKFMDGVHLPTTEAKVAVLPPNNREAYYKTENGTTSIKPEYIKKVEYKK